MRNAVRRVIAVVAPDTMGRGDVICVADLDASGAPLWEVEQSATCPRATGENAAPMATATTGRRGSTTSSRSHRVEGWTDVRPPGDNRSKRSPRESWWTTGTGLLLRQRVSLQLVWCATWAECLQRKRKLSGPVHEPRAEISCCALCRTTVTAISQSCVNKAGSACTAPASLAVGIDCAF